MGLLPARRGTPVLLVMLACAILFCATGCSSGHGGGVAATPENAQKGFFIDSPVEGLEYRTSSWSGFTDEQGGFYYQQGEQITFSIGDVVLGRTAAKPIITPVDLGGSPPTTSNRKVVNISRLLLSLDQDGDPTNGITISRSIHDALKDLRVDLTDPALDTSAGIREMFDRLNGMGIYPEEVTRLVSAEEAQIHLENTLNQIEAEAEEEEQALLNLKLHAFIASPSGNIIMVQGQSLTLQSAVYGGRAPYAYSWRFGDDPPFSDKKDPGTMAFRTEGSFLLHFTADDGTGDTREDSRLITVLGPETQEGPFEEDSIPTVTITYPAYGSSFKVGDTVNFLAVIYNGDPPLSYGWTLGSAPGNSFSGTSAQLVTISPRTYVAVTQGITLNSPGTYLISIVVKDTNTQGKYPDTHASSVMITVD